MEARKIVKQSSWSSQAHGRIFQKGAKLLRTKQIKEAGENSYLVWQKSAKIIFLPHSITLAYKEIKCIFEKRGFMPQGQSLPPLPLHWLHHCLLIIAGGAHRRRYSRTTPSPHHSSLFHSGIDEW
jgi:hypothetical protein